MLKSREQEFQRNNTFSQNDLYGHPIAKGPLSRGHEIFNFGRPFLGHHYYLLILSESCR